MRTGHSYSIFAMLLLSMALSSCGKFGTGEQGLRYLPVKIGKEDAKISIIDIDGKVVVEDEFSSGSNILVTEGIVTETTDAGEVRYWKLEKGKVKQLGEEKFAAGTPFFEGHAVVRDDRGMLSLINTEGKEVVPNLSRLGKHTVVRTGVPGDGCIRFKTDEGLWGYIDLKGEETIAPRFSTCEDFQSGKARAILPDGSFVVIDKGGNEIFKGREGHSYLPLVGDRLPFKEEGGKYWGVVDLKGEKVIKDTKFEDFNEYNGSTYVVRREKREWGVIGSDGEFLGELRAKFEEAPILSRDGIIVVNRDKEAKVYDAKGNPIKDIEDYKAVIPISRERFIAQQRNDKFVIIDKDGKELSKDAFLMVGPFVQYRLGAAPSIASLTRNSEFGIESTYFEFDPIFKSVFKNLSVEGVAGVTANSGIAAVLKAYPYGKEEARASRGSRTSRSEDYTYIMTSAGSGKSNPRVEVVEPSPVTEDVRAAADSSAVEAPEPAPVITVKDDHPYLSQYSQNYTTRQKSTPMADYILTFRFDRELKQEILGTDPIFTNIMTVVGYRLNPEARLQSVDINLDLHDADIRQFWSQFKKAAEAAGFVEEESGIMTHKDNRSRKIRFAGGSFQFYFSAP